MKPKYVYLLLIGAILGFAINAVAQQTSPRPNHGVAEFEIELVVDRADNVVRMKCIEGCMWETLSFGCDSSGPDCAGSFDESGTPAD
jgi:hypothetical protein